MIGEDLKMVCELYNKIVGNLFECWFYCDIVSYVFDMVVIVLVFFLGIGDVWKVIGNSKVFLYNESMKLLLVVVFEN